MDWTEQYIEDIESLKHDLWLLEDSAKIMGWSNQKLYDFKQYTLNLIFKYDQRSLIPEMVIPDTELFRFSPVFQASYRIAKESFSYNLIPLI